VRRQILAARNILDSTHSAPERPPFRFRIHPDTASETRPLAFQGESRGTRRHILCLDLFDIWQIRFLVVVVVVRVSVAWRSRMTAGDRMVVLFLVRFVFRVRCQGFDSATGEDAVSVDSRIYLAAEESRHSGSESLVRILSRISRHANPLSV
jgi:hypothetical protein